MLGPPTGPTARPKACLRHLRGQRGVEVEVVQRQRLELGRGGEQAARQRALEVVLRQHELRELRLRVARAGDGAPVKTKTNGEMPLLNFKDPY